MPSTPADIADRWPAFLVDPRLRLLLGGAVGASPVGDGAAIALARSGSIEPVRLIPTDPADPADPDAAAGVHGDGVRSPNPDVDAFQAAAAQHAFMLRHGATLATIAERGTTLDDDEFRRLLEASVPEMIELMASMAIAERMRGVDGPRPAMDSARIDDAIRRSSGPETMDQWLDALDGQLETHRLLLSTFGAGTGAEEQERFVQRLREGIHGIQACMWGAASCRASGTASPAGTEHGPAALLRPGAAGPEAVFNRIMPPDADWLALLAAGQSRGQGFTALLESLATRCDWALPLVGVDGRPIASAPAPSARPVPGWRPETTSEVGPDSGRRPKTARRDRLDGPAPAADAMPGVPPPVAADFATSAPAWTPPALPGVARLAPSVGADAPVTTFSASASAFAPSSAASASPARAPLEATPVVPGVLETVDALPGIEGMAPAAAVDPPSFAPPSFAPPSFHRPPAPHMTPAPDFAPPGFGASPVFESPSLNPAVSLAPFAAEPPPTFEPPKFGSASAFAAAPASLPVTPAFARPASDPPSFAPPSFGRSAAPAAPPVAAVASAPMPDDVVVVPSWSPPAGPGVEPPGPSADPAPASPDPGRSTPAGERSAPVAELPTSPPESPGASSPVAPSAAPASEPIPCASASVSGPMTNVTGFELLIRMCHAATQLTDDPGLDLADEGFVWLTDDD